MYNRIKIGHNCKQFFISLQERTDAKALFKTKKGKEQLHEIEKRAKTFVPGAPLPGAGGAAPRAAAPAGLTPQQVRNIKAQIAKASTLDEIERLSHMLRTGQNPDAAAAAPAENGNGHGNVVEMDEDE